MREHWLTLNVGVVALVDCTAFNHDNASISQVGRGIGWGSLIRVTNQ